MKVVIETKRLLLREMEERDLDFVAGLYSDPLVMRFFPKLYSRKEAQASLERQIFRYKINGHGFWIMEDKQLKKPVGQLGLAMQVVNFKAEPEIGYILHRDHRHKGYATEGGIATRDYAFGTLNYPYVISLIRPINLPSQAVAKRLGMKISRKTSFYNLEHFVFRVEAAELQESHA